MLIRWHSFEPQRLRNSSPDPRVRAPTQPRAADAPADLPQPQTGLSGFPLRASLPPLRAPEVYNKPPWGKARDGEKRRVEGLRAGKQWRGYIGACISTGLVSDGQLESVQLSSGYYVNTVIQLELKIYDFITSVFYWNIFWKIKKRSTWMDTAWH